MTEDQKKIVDDILIQMKRNAGQTDLNQGACQAIFRKFPAIVWQPIPEIMLQLGLIERVNANNKYADQGQVRLTPKGWETESFTGQMAKSDLEQRQMQSVIDNNLMVQQSIRVQQRLLYITTAVAVMSLVISILAYFKK